MKTIRVLAPEVVDQIAAGEVVERPAHLVKELVENSLDAGAKSIEVDFNQGGRHVRVTDDGVGVAPDQLALALARHATSKINLSSDIWDLSSFGFRGEALASIGAVCRLTLTSRRPEDKLASQVKCQFGQISEVKEVGGECGTTILVEDLFSNVPARLKFLKSDSAESTQIKNVIKALAMANPEVEFRVRTKGELLFYWATATSAEQRVQQILENETLFAVEGEHHGIKVRAVLSNPNDTVRTSRQMWFFAQDRWIQDRSLQAAVIEAYRNLLMHGEYPVAAIFVSLDPQQIDVNIHPTKSQVKFQDGRQVFQAVHRTLRDGLEKAPWIAELTGHEPKGSEPSLGDTKGFDVTESHRLEQQQSLSDPSLEKTQYSTKSYPIFEGSEPPSARGQATRSQSVTMEVLKDYAPSASARVEPQGDYKSASGDGQWTRLQVLGQADLTYIVCQSDKAVVFIDQHASHERIMFERLSKAYQSGEIETQAYLIPLTIDLDASEVEAILTQLDELKKLGLEVEASGPDSISVRCGPSFLKDKAIVEALQKLGAEIVDRGGSFAFERSVKELLATMACHSAIRAGQALSSQEMVSLLAQMDEFPLSSFCPHGRPVFVEYPFLKLEKDFGRIV